MADDDRIISGEALDANDEFGQLSLRPQFLNQYIGQATGRVP